MRIDLGHVAFDTVDEHERRAAVDGVVTADVDGSDIVRRTVGCGHEHSWNRALKHVGKCRRGPVVEFLGSDGGNRSGKIYLLLHAVSDHDGFLKVHRILGHIDRNIVLRRLHCLSHCRIAEADEFESHGFRRNGQ